MASHSGQHREPVHSPNADSMHISTRKTESTGAKLSIRAVTPVCISLLLPDTPSNHSTVFFSDKVEFMKRLGHRVNLIPVIAKADTLTDAEIKAFKARILDDIAMHNIPVYTPTKYVF